MTSLGAIMLAVLIYGDNLIGGGGGDGSQKSSSKNFYPSIFAFQQYWAVVLNKPLKNNCLTTQQQ
jgi:hypothetical protein